MIPSLRVAKQNELALEEYSQAMMMELKELEKQMMQAFNSLVIQKKKIVRTYNKRVKKKSFSVGELV